MNLEVSAKQATEMLETFLQAKLVPLIKGSPGIGKSAIVHSIAEKYDLQLIDIRLSQCDPTDLSGFPTLVDGKKADYLPMAHFPIEGDPLPEGKNGWLIFLDELTSALPAIQAASYKLILDRMVGTHKLHKNVAIVAAGNLETDNAIVQTMSTALLSRMVHMQLKVSMDDWLEWASKNNIDHRITDFIKFKPSNLYTFNPDTENTYACPRTWEFANRLMTSKNTDSPNFIYLLAGTVSEGVAREFISFIKCYKKIPTVQQILSDPERTKVPEEASLLYALTGSISNHMKEENIGTLIKYIYRIPPEFQVVCMKDAVRRYPNLLNHKEVDNWLTKQSGLLF